MKRRTSLSLLVGLCFPMVAVVALGQITVPPNPNDVTRRKIGESGGGGSAAVSVSPPAAASRTIVIQYTAVSPMRQWTNADGKTMVARLLAFSAPQEGTVGPVEVIREGTVRFLLDRGKEPIDYPLVQLSQADQIDIKAIAQAAKRGSPAAQAKDEAASGDKGQPEAKP